MITVYNVDPLLLEVKIDMKSKIVCGLSSWAIIEVVGVYGRGR